MVSMGKVLEGVKKWWTSGDASPLATGAYHRRLPLPLPLLHTLTFSVLRSPRLVSASCKLQSPTVAHASLASTTLPSTQTTTTPRP